MQDVTSWHDLAGTLARRGASWGTAAGKESAHNSTSTPKAPTGTGLSVEFKYRLGPASIKSCAQPSAIDLYFENAPRASVTHTWVSHCCLSEKMEKP